jgi:hypothetical protein
MVSNLNLSDVWTCYKAFTREVLENLDLREDRFGFEQEITVRPRINKGTLGLAKRQQAGSNQFGIGLHVCKDAS